MQKWVELAAQVLLRLTDLSGALPGGGWELCLFFATSLSVWRLHPPALPRVYQSSLRGVTSKGLFFVYFPLSFWLWTVLSYSFFFFTPERISVLWEQSPPREDNSQPGREVELKQFLPLE